MSSNNKQQCKSKCLFAISANVKDTYGHTHNWIVLMYVSNSKVYVDRY